MADPPAPVLLAPTTRFQQRVKKLTDREKRALARALRLFVADPRDPRLGTHKLHGRQAEYWAFGFGSDARVVFAWDRSGPRPVAVLLDVGSHDEVYE